MEADHNEKQTMRPPAASGRILSLNMGEEVDACYSDAPPPCVSACPFSLDAVLLMERLKKKNFSGAWRLLREKLLLPEIVNAICHRPCETGCLRGSVDGVIRIGALEAATIRFGAGGASRFNIPKQPRTIAVVGGGLCGAGAALTLASAGYSVTLYEKTDVLGGRLSERMDPAVYGPLLAERLENLDCTVVYGHEVMRQELPEGFDGILWATGDMDGRAEGSGADPLHCETEGSAGDHPAPDQRGHLACGTAFTGARNPAGVDAGPLTCEAEGSALSNAGMGGEDPSKCKEAGGEPSRRGMGGEDPSKSEEEDGKPSRCGMGGEDPSKSEEEDGKSSRRGMEGDEKRAPHPARERVSSCGCGGNVEHTFDSDRVFFCGIPEDAPAVTALTAGMEAAKTIQNWLKTGNRRPVEKGAGSVAPARDMFEAAPVPSGGASDIQCPEHPSGRHEALKQMYRNVARVARRGDEEIPVSQEAAAEEAALCLTCRCDLCRQACDYMRHYNILPKKLLNNVRVNLNPMEGLRAHVATRMIFSCNACGACGQVCSEGIDMGEIILLARSLMHRDGSAPPVFHDFWMRDMDHALGAESRLLRHAPDTNRSQYLFFPGCQLGGAAPQLVVSAWARLRRLEPETGVFLSCCGAPALWAGQEAAFETVISDTRKAWEEMARPVIVWACPTCGKMLKRSLPEIPAISLYQILDGGDRLPAPPPPRTDDPCAGLQPCQVFDPCSAAYDKSAGVHVRNLVRAMGWKPAGAEAPGIPGGCCGFGGHIESANQELARKIGARKAAVSLPIVTWCINCRDIFRKHGNPALHILELQNPPTEALASPAPAEDPFRVCTLTERRRNRTALKKELLTDRAAEDHRAAEAPSLILHFAEGLQEKMDREFMLEDDVAAVIRDSRQEGNELMDSESGSLIAHKKLGHMTCWAIYRESGEGFFVENVYSHRMSLTAEVEDG